MVFPWIVDAISSIAGINVYRVGGFYIQSTYNERPDGLKYPGLAISTERGGNRRKTIRRYFHLASFTVMIYNILLSPAVGTILLSLSTVIVAINAGLLRI